ncbi:MAG: hypothetical protein ACK53L_11460, partial [Pirellulaceae bacterium]
PTQQGKQNAADAVLASPSAQLKGLIGIEIDGDEIKLTYTDSAKNTQFTISENGQPISLLDWARKGSEIHDIVSDDILLTGYSKDAVGNTDYVGVKATRKG